MRVTRFINVVLILVFSFSASIAANQQDESPLPNPTSPIMDYAGVMDESLRKSVEKKILDFRESSNPTVEIGVAVIKTTEGRPIFDYSLAVARGWKIGTTEKDNPGLLLLVAIDDRKYFTQVSRDLEDELTDGLVGSIQRKYLVPEFKKGNYGKGIADTVDAYIETIKAKQAGEPAPIEKEKSEEHAFLVDGWAQDLFDLFCCLAVIIIFILIIFAASSPGNKGGGGGGGRRRKRKGSGFGEAAIDIATGIAIGAITSGGGSSSSSDWGGGFDSGGFGGFGGGGSFGGGGAGGGW